MKKWVEKIEDRACRKWGFENWKTVATFKATEIVRKVVR